MKHRIISAVLVSGLVLNTLAPTLVTANDFDTQIANKDKVISNLTAEQAKAKEQVSAIQSQVKALQAKQDALAAENTKLQAESKELENDVQVLSQKIVARNNQLKQQARSAQKNKKSTSYINSILQANSLSEAVSRMMAIRKVVSANEKLLKQQQSDKKVIEEKQKANQEAINTVAANQETLAANAFALATQKAELEVAQLALASSLATAENEKASLVSAKAEAEAKARAAAEAQARAKAEAEAQAAAQLASVATAQTTFNQSVQNAVAASQPVVAPAATRVTTTSTGNVYPVGECTWGAKELAPWAGNHWGNAVNWAAAAAASGFRVGSTPAVGAIVVWSGGATGHVAVVTAVESDTRIQVMESNVLGNRYISNFRGWFNPIGIQGHVSYIYPN